MDPITHGLTGALIGKALFAGHPRATGAQQAAPLQGRPFASQHATQDKQEAGDTGRVAVWVCIAAAMFPDVDVFFEPFVRWEMAAIELHRGVTHSLACLPLFVAAMATVTWWWVGRRKKEKGKSQKEQEPRERASQDRPAAGDTKLSWPWFAGMWAAGMVSHMMLDAATSWGTMLWAPLSRARTAWDWAFIIDFTLTGIVLLPQVAAWVYARREGAMWRAASMWAVFAACAAGVGWIARRFEAPFEAGVIPVTIAVLGVLFFAGMFRVGSTKAKDNAEAQSTRRGAEKGVGWGFGVSRAGWCRAGLLALAGYYGLCAWMHSRALDEVREFAAAQQLRVDALGALPMPPAATRWLGLIRTPDGVYRAYFNVAANPGPRFEYIADDKMPEAVARAVDALPEVQTYRWFARFPVVSYRLEDGRHVVELVDHRFYPGASSRPAPFQYRVVVNAYGEVEKQGWIED